MSRPEPGDDIATIPLFPPASGLFKPYRVLNPFTAQGRCTSFKGFRLTNSTIRAFEEKTLLMGQDHDSVTPPAPFANNVRAISSYRSTTRNDIIYIASNFSTNLDIRAFPLDNSAVEVVAQLNIATDNGERIAYTRFRNRILFATTQNGLWWYDPETRTARKAGVTVPTAPTLADGGASTLPAGTYEGVVTFVNDQGHDGNPSAQGSVVLGANRQITWTIPVGPAGTTARRLYRNAGVAGQPKLFVQTVNDNVTVTVTESVAAASLGAAVDTDNTAPPTNIRQIASSLSRVALLDMDGLTIWFSKIDATTGQPNWESFPSKLSLAMAFSGGEDVGRAVIHWNGDWYVFSGLRLARIVGDIATGVVIEQPPIGMGIIGPYAWAVIPGKGIAFINNFKQMFLYDGTELKNLGEDVQGIFDDLNPILKGCSGPDVTFDPMWNSLYVNFCTTAGVTRLTNNKTLVLDLESGQWTESLWQYDVSHYSEFFREYFGVRHLSDIYGWWPLATEVTTIAMDAFTAPLVEIEWHRWSPSPGDDIDFLTFQFNVLAGMKSSGIVPRFRVEYNFDGAPLNVGQKKHMCAYDRRRLTDSSTTSLVVIPVSIPIYRIARSISIRFTLENSSATRATLPEIFSIMADVRILSQSKVERMNIGEGSRRLFKG